jgi:hypothetical protein
VDPAGRPAIDAISNTGDAFLVNAYFAKWSDELDTTLPTTLIAYEGGDESAPAGYGAFAFSTRQTTKPGYTIYAYQDEAQVGQVVRSADQDPEILSTLDTRSPLGVELLSEAEPTVLEVTKEVGKGVDQTLAFTFTVYFETSDGTPMAGETLVSAEFPLSVGKIPFPQDYILDKGGKATFTLVHGRGRRFVGLEPGARVRVVETATKGYTASWQDSADPGESVAGRDTGTQDLGEGTRRFAFLNEVDLGPATVPLTIGKLVVGESFDFCTASLLWDTDISFGMTLYVADANGGPLAGESFAYQGANDGAGWVGTCSTGGIDNPAPADGTVTLDAEGRAFFTLKHGQTVTLDLPEDAQVRVVETAVPEYFATHSLTHTIEGVTAGADTGFYSLTGEDDVPKGDPDSEVMFINMAELLQPLTISKQVSGTPDDPDQAFTFSLQLLNSEDQPDADFQAGVPINYTGGSLSAAVDPPADGSLELDSNAEATFTLQDNQSITLWISKYAQVRVVERLGALAARYSPSFNDSEEGPQTATLGADTGPRPMVAGARTFAFHNSWFYVPPSGLDTSSAPLVVPVLALAALLTAWYAARRRFAVRAWARAVAKLGGGARHGRPTR